MIKEKGTKRMKIKQQRQINAFLVNLFGNSRGDMLFRQQEELLDTLIRNTENKTKDQMKTLTQTILPRIALYKVHRRMSTGICETICWISLEQKSICPW